MQEFIVVKGSVTSRHPKWSVSSNSTGKYCSDGPQCHVVCLVYSLQSRLWYTFATLAGASSSWKPFLLQDVIMFLDAHVLPVPGRS